MEKWIEEHFTAEMDIRKRGFRDTAEFVTLTSSVDTSDPIKRMRFQLWRQTDGTRQGLIDVINSNGTMEKTDV